MSGKIELISTGKDDIFLTGNPEVTLFKEVYRRYTNFAIDLLQYTFDDEADFGTISSFKLPKISDLIHKIYLKIKIPEFFINNSNKNELLNYYNEEKVILQTNYNILKMLFKYNMMSFNKINELYQNINITSENIFTIMDNNTQIFESYMENTAKNLILLILENKNLCRLKTSNLSNLNIITKKYSYGNYKNTLTISSDNIKSYIGSEPIIDNNTSIENINIINTEYKNNVFKTIKQIIIMNHNLDKDYVDLINQNNEDILKNNINIYKFAWVKRLGHCILDYVEIYIGGYCIDKQYGQWMDIWWELSGNKDQEESYMKMIGNVPELTLFENTIKPSYTLYIPLQFWFCRSIDLSLPTIALNSSDIIFKCKFRKFSELSYTELQHQTYDDDNKIISNGTLDDIIENKNLHIEVNILVEVIYLDIHERKAFARAVHEYLIDQLQYNVEKVTLNYTLSSNLNFRHPCKGIIWIIQKYNTLINLDNTTECQWTNYTGFDHDNNPIHLLTQAKINIDNFNITEYNNINYFNYTQPYQHFKNSPKMGIYSYWFALFPQETHPSGSCNLSHLKNVKLEYKINPNIIENNINEISINQDSYVIKFFSLNHNILRIKSGFGNVGYI